MTIRELINNLSVYNPEAEVELSNISMGVDMVVEGMDARFDSESQKPKVHILLWESSNENEKEDDNAN